MTIDEPQNAYTCVIIDWSLIALNQLTGIDCYWLIVCFSDDRFSLIRPGKKKKLFSVHPSQFFQVGRAVFFFFCNEVYFVFNIQWGTSLHLQLSDYETTIPLFTMKPTTTIRKKLFEKSGSLMHTT